MSDSRLNLQDTFLQTLRNGKIPSTIFLVNGIKLQGVITGFDNFSIVLRREAHAQLIYKHAISTVMPNAPLPTMEGEVHIDQTAQPL
ncbi:MAG: RNA chaperone Hfq [Bdellovibrionales bacterium]